LDAGKAEQRFKGYETTKDRSQSGLGGSTSGHLLTMSYQVAAFITFPTAASQNGVEFLNLEHESSHDPYAETLFHRKMSDSLVAYHLQNGTGRMENKFGKNNQRDDREENILLSVEVPSDWLRTNGFFTSNGWKLSSLVVGSVDTEAPIWELLLLC